MPERGRGLRLDLLDAFLAREDGTVVEGFVDAQFGEADLG